MRAFRVPFQAIWHLACTVEKGMGLGRATHDVGKEKQASRTGNVSCNPASHHDQAA